jgi:hypothetical protein
MALLGSIGSMFIPTIVGNVAGRALFGKRGGQLGSLAGAIYGGRGFFDDLIGGPNPILLPDTVSKAANQVAPGILGNPTLNQSLLQAPQVNGILTGSGNTPLSLMDKITQGVTQGANELFGPVGDFAENYPTMTNMGANMAAMSMLQPPQRPPVIASGMEGATITPNQGNPSGRVPGLKTDPVRVTYSPDSLYPVSPRGVGGRQMFYY